MLINKLDLLINIITWTWYFPIALMIIYILFYKKITMSIIVYFLMSTLLIINISKFDNALSNFELNKYQVVDFKISKIFVDNKYYGINYFIDNLGYFDIKQNEIIISDKTISNYKKNQNYVWNLPDERFLYTINFLFKNYLNKNNCKNKNYVIEINKKTFRYCI